MQALRLKAAAAPEEDSSEVQAEALAMLREDPTRYQIICTSAELLQTSKSKDTVVPGATLEVCKLHFIYISISKPAGLKTLLSTFCAHDHARHQK